MKRYLFPLICLGFLHRATAQQLFPLVTQLDSLEFTAGAADRHIALQWKEPVSNLNRRNSIVSLEAINLSDADLVLTYSPNKQPRGFNHRIEWYWKDLSDGVITYPDAYSTKTIPGKNGSNQLIWMDASETPLIFGHEYRMYIKVYLLGPVDCNAERPDFNLKEQLPYYAVGIGALAITSVGIAINIQKKNDYQRYVNQWEAGTKEAVAKPDIISARKKKDRAAKVIYGGMAVLGLDAMFWVIRAVKTKQQQRIYDRFCIRPLGTGFIPNPRETKYPNFDLPAFGFQLSCRF